MKPRSHYAAIGLTLVILRFGVTGFALPDCPCGSEGHGDHDRWKMKTRNKDQVPPATKTSVDKMMQWKIPKKDRPAQEDLEEILKHSQPVTDWPYPREAKAFKVSGILRRVKMADDDCDIHMEIAGRGQGDARIIAELPNTHEYCQLRKAVMDELNDRRIKLNGKDLPNRPRITVTGYAFFDSWHTDTKAPRKGHNHGSPKVGTLWEIHPITHVEWN